MEHQGPRNSRRWSLRRNRELGRDRTTTTALSQCLQSWSPPRPAPPSPLPSPVRGRGMVGLFGFASKGSPAKAQRNAEVSPTPPPPYSQDSSDPAFFATETTTTTTTHVVTTTTQTTTHFFSLPLWRRRVPAEYPHNHTAARSTDELGLFGAHQEYSSGSMQTRNKDLPPTPELSPEHLTPSSRLSPDPHFSQDGDDPRHVGRKGRKSGAPSVASSRASSLQPVSRSSYAPGESSQPTVALARAALGLGLPHASPSTTELNTVSFLPPPSPITSDGRRAIPLVRHAKSFYKEPSVAQEDPSSSTPRERRRTRGLSLGPLNLMSSDAKGKQRESDAPPEPKPLTRKGSFWTRRRVNSRPESAAPPSPLPQPSLPAFPPISPFVINTPVPSPGLAVSVQPPELHRRHSERTRKQSHRKEDEKPPPDMSPRMSTASVHSRRRRGSQRPQTADSAGSPRLSFFAESRPLATSPNSSPLPTPQERAVPPSYPSTQVEQQQPPQRTRAHTNPPLLHRLSINLFGSSSPSAHTPTSSNSPNILDGHVTSPPSSLGSSRPSLSKPSVEIPRPRSDEESPEVYLQRLVEAVSKAEVATVLASRYEN